MVLCRLWIASAPFDGDDSAVRLKGLDLVTVWDLVGDERSDASMQMDLVCG